MSISVRNLVFVSALTLSAALAAGSAQAMGPMNGSKTGHLPGYKATPTTTYAAPAICHMPFWAIAQRYGANVAFYVKWRCKRVGRGPFGGPFGKIYGGYN
jgi:hypothetical protein